MTADEAFAHALAPGTEVQGYRIISVLGAGGFGVTYLAEHVAMSQRVALKEFLPGGIATRAKTGDTVHPLSPAYAEDYVWGLARFRDEARTLARLKHPGIVAVMNYFEANGTAYCAMEHVSGDTLDARLGPRGRLDAGTLARMVPPLLDGIEAVHAAGFLHRDIKPGNILLNERGPVLIDFGAARQALGAHSRSLTAVLSEGYAPYEQYQRDGDQGPWTDIYALGGTLYRCVTGERPPEATKRIQARIKQKPDPLVPASEAAAGRYPAPLLAAIDAALAAMEGDRPQSIAALRAMIGQRPGPRGGDTLIAGGAPSSVPRVDPAPVPGKPRHVAGRRRWPAVAAAALILGSAGAAAYVVLGERNAQQREAERIAAEARRKAEEEAKRKAEQEEAKRRAEDDARRRREAEEAEQRRKAEEERRRADEDHKQADKAAENLERGIQAYDRKDFDEALRLLTDALSSAKLPPRSQARAFAARARTWAAKNDRARAISDADSAIQADKTFPFGWAVRAILRAESGRNDGALADINEAIRLDPTMPFFLTYRGYIYEKTNRRAEAMADYRGALRLQPNYTLALDGLRRLGVSP
jgi:serine/threonine protein kinase